MRRKLGTCAKECQGKLERREGYIYTLVCLYCKEPGTFWVLGIVAHFRYSFWKVWAEKREGNEQKIGRITQLLGDGTRQPTVWGPSNRLAPSALPLAKEIKWDTCQLALSISRCWMRKDYELRKLDFRIWPRELAESVNSYHQHSTRKVLPKWSFKYDQIIFISLFAKFVPSKASWV